MNINELSHAQSETSRPGSISFEVSLALEDLETLRLQADRALALERELPEDARTPLGNADDATYANAFIETRAVNDALEAQGIVPVAAPRVKTRGLSSGELLSCAVTVVPRPPIGLTSLSPADLKTRRVPKPGFSAKGAGEDDSVEYVDDDKVLRRALMDRLDSELPEPAIRALADDYQTAFEKELFKLNIDPESYQLAHGLNEEQYLLMMARNALADAHWNYALDAVFAGCQLSLDEDDLLDYFENEHPGCAQQLMELYELRGELWKAVEKVRRAKALAWLRKNAIA